MIAWCHLSSRLGQLACRGEWTSIDRAFKEHCVLFCFCQRHLIKAGEVQMASDVTRRPCGDYDKLRVKMIAEHERPKMIYKHLQHPSHLFSEESSCYRTCVRLLLCGLDTRSFPHSSVRMAMSQTQPMSCSVMVYIGIVSMPERSVQGCVFQGTILYTQGIYPDMTRSRQFNTICVKCLP